MDMGKLKGCGLGLRREFIQEVIPSDFKPDFWEVTPENWIHMPYHHKEAFEQIVLNNKTVAHGLSLSIGGDERPNKKFLKTIKTFLDKYKIEDYSEHISFSSFSGMQSYELLPLPLTKKMVNLLSDRVKYVEDFLGRSLILENATYYYVPDAKMSEVEFINELIHKSGVRLLLDVNNVYVNSINHNFDAKKFIDDLDKSSVAYMHIAGHFDDKESGLLIDTHGMGVKDEVWNLYKYTLKQVKAPSMIERDNNVPPLKQMIKEYKKLKKIYKGI
jgi:uncharacterized protein (UPF0276 family)